LQVNVTAWAKGLEVSGDGTGVVSHAGLGLLRRLADKTGLTGGLSRALSSGRVLGHDRGRVLADISCVIAGGARGISDFRVLADQREAFGQVASVPTAYRTLEEIADGGARAERKLTAAINAARRHAWRQVVARHGRLPGVRLGDKTLEQVTCIRIDATVTPAHSDKELAEANFKGFGHHPLLAYCDNTGGEPLAWMLRKWRGQNAYTDAAHRVHARVEDAIRTGKDTGIGRFPSHDFKINQAWLTAAMTAQILLAWLKLLALDGDLAKAEPKTLRYRILHAAARLVHGGRRKRWKFPANWPWTEAITRA
jgi:hypothetical protein